MLCMCSSRMQYLVEGGGREEGRREEGRREREDGRGRGSEKGSWRSRVEFRVENVVHTTQWLPGNYRAALTGYPLGSGLCQGYDIIIVN